MKDTLALIIPAFSLFAYMVLSSIEFGASFFSLFPALFADRNMVRDYMNPLWEATTIFLAFALISLFSFFPGATLRWTTDLFGILFTFLIIFGIRIISILLLHYGDARSSVMRWLYVASSTGSAVTGAVIMTYFLTGTWHLSEQIYIWLAILAVSAIIFAASSFFRSYANAGKLTGLVRLAGTIFFASVTFFITALFRTYPYLLSSWSTVYTPCLLIGAIVGAVVAEMRRMYLGTFYMYILGAAAVFWGFFAAHLPFIVYPSVTMAASVTNDASFKVLMVSLIIGSIFVVPALILLYTLF